jgi:hypothetical protein
VVFRLEKLGFFAKDEMNVICCYATQDKFLVTDPNGNEWGFFYTEKDVENLDSNGTVCCEAVFELKDNRPILHVVYQMCRK